jgi:hypothetical protein
MATDETAGVEGRSLNFFLFPPAFSLMLCGMDTESLDPYALEARWHVNDRELDRIRAMPGLDRRMISPAWMR